MPERALESDFPPDLVTSLSARQPMAAALASAGFGTIEDVEGGAHAIMGGPEPGRKLALRRYDKLPKGDLHRLMAASTFAVGVTGDGSLSDALRLGRAPLYQVLQHKRPAFLACADVAREAVRSPALDAFLAEVLNDINIPAYSRDDGSPRDRFTTPYMVEHAQKLGRLMKDPALAAGARELGRVVAEKHDAAPRIEALVTMSVLAHRHDDVRRAHEAAEQALAKHGAGVAGRRALAALHATLDRVAPRET